MGNRYQLRTLNLISRQQILLEYRKLVQAKWKLKKDHLCTMVDQENSSLSPDPEWLQFSSVAQSCPDSLRPGLSVHHQLPEIIQTHVYRVGDAIQSSHSLSSPSPPAPKSLPASGSFPMSQLIAWGGQSIGVSASASVLPMNTQDWSPIGWIGWISLSPRESQESFQHHNSKASIFRHSAFFTVQLSHPYITTGKTIALTRWTFVGKVMSLPFNMLFRLVITFLPRSKRLLISWLQSPSAVILGPRKTKSDTVSTVSPSISHKVMGPDAMILVFWMLSSQPPFSFSSFTFIKRFFSSSSLSAIRLLILLLAVFLFQRLLHPAQHFSWCTLHIS